LQALRFAFDRAYALDAALVPVIAWEPPGGDSVARPYPSSVTDGWADAAEERLLRALVEGLGAPPDDLPAASHVIRGRPGHVLVAVADHPDDLLVVGKGRSGILRRAWSGSVTRHCLALATCPVIAVPQTAPASDAQLARPMVTGDG
jgi:nucleotide-binding universal stress UspA family protein